MKIIDWNVRDLGCDKKKTLIYQTITENKPDIVCLQETKLNQIDKFSATKFLPRNYRNFFFQPANSLAGGLLTAWNCSTLTASLFSTSQSHLATTFNSTSKNSTISVINIYAPCDEHDILQFFEIIASTKENLTGPLMILGNFNIYRFPHENNNDNIIWPAMEAFNTWINNQELIDIDIPNRMYTWTNKQRNPTLVKLDRVFVNISWTESSSTTEALALTATTSHHTPVLVSISSDTTHSKNFRIENYWLQMPEFKELVQTDWGRATRTLSNISTLNLKFRRLRARIQNWNIKKSGIQKLLHINKHAVNYQDQLEEWRGVKTTSKS